MSKQKTTINKNTNISLFDSLSPIFLLVGLLYVNVNIYGDSSLEGSNQFILLIGAAIAFLVGLKNKIQVDFIFNAISKNIKSISNPIIILLLVGALSGTWLLSGIIPSMIYYPIPIHNQVPYKNNQSLENTELLSKEVISLPIHTEIENSNQEYIIEKIDNFFK